MRKNRTFDTKKSTHKANSIWIQTRAEKRRKKNHQRTQNFKCLYLHYRIRGEERDADWLRITFWGELCMSVRPFGIIKILLMAKVFLNRFNRLKFYSLCIFPYCSCGAGDLDTANINISLDAKWNIPNLVHICSDLHIDSYHICGVE